MNWLEILRIVLQGVLLIVTGLVGAGLGGARMKSRILSLKPPPAATRSEETIIVHEGMIDGDALRLTLRTKSRIASFLVPREIVYHMSDDLLRSAAQLGKRGEVQRGPES